MRAPSLGACRQAPLQSPAPRQLLSLACAHAHANRAARALPRSYEDIPEEDNDSAEQRYGGMTLDQYMSQMVTTPASAAATSGLGSSGSPVDAQAVGERARAGAVLEVP